MMLQIRQFQIRLLASGLLLGLFLAMAPLSAARAADSAAEAPYKIQPGDVIEIAVVGLPDFHYKSVVNRDGTAVLPMIAPVKLAGLDLAAAQALVKDQLSRKLYQQRGPDGREIVTAISPDSVLLTIAEYRPVYLNGDVTRPGEQAYRPGLTVRQAVSLAGGYEIMRFRAENPFLKSADLRTDYQTQWIQYVREQARIWRLRTELAAADKDGNKDGPTASLEKLTDAPVPKDQLEEQRRIARQQLELETGRHAAEQAFLENAVKVANDQIALLSDRKTKDNENAAADAADYKRLRDLADRGVVPMNRLSEARRLFLYSATQALQTTVQVTNTIRERDEAQRQIGRFVEKRRGEILKELGEASATVAEIRSRLQSVSEKITYTGIIRSQLVRGSGAKPTITITHAAASGGGKEVASEESLVQPGDTIEVALEVDMPSAKSQ
jgi:polysaccharide export outer membrane protein